MTDAGSLPAADGSGTADERSRLLRQIAAVLDLPVSAFTRAAREEDAGNGPSSAECSAMLATFSRIHDPQARSFCLKVMETFARR